MAPADSGSTAGRLLVATPTLLDPNFNRTVVLMLEHTDEGSLGLVLNRPSPLEVATALPDWERYTALPPVVFVGGPVSQGSVIALARGTTVAARESEAWAPLRAVPGIGVIDLGKDPVEHGVTVEEVRVFSGYAGWGGGQLEDEIDEHAWYVVDAAANDVMTASPRELWATVLRRQGGALGRVAMYPEDIRVN